jgi:hypothetical protein
MLGDAGCAGRTATAVGAGTLSFPRRWPNAAAPATAPARKIAPTNLSITLMLVPRSADNIPQ